MHSPAIRTKDGMNKYPAKAHAQRVADKLGASDGLVVLSATRNVNLPNSDMPAPFRQDRYFYYLTGCNEPDCHVVYDLKKDKLTLWLPPVDNDWRHVVYYGNGSTIEQAMEKYDIDEARYIEKLDAESLKTPFSAFVHSADYHLTRSAKKDLQRTMIATQLHRYKINDIINNNRESCEQHPASMPVHTVQDILFLGQLGTSDRINCITGVDSDSSLKFAIDGCRAIKDDYEIDCIRRANLITAEAHENVMKGMSTFNNEAQVEAVYMQVCIARHAKAQAYDPIAGSGPNAAVLHYSENSASFGAGQTIVLDAGCEVECYAADVTRTIPINEHKPGHWPSQEAADIYKLVEKIQEACIKEMLPGNKYINATWLAHEMLIDGFLELGIFKGDPQDIFHAGTSTAFLPHGLGHHVGLEVHDVSPLLTFVPDATGSETMEGLWALYTHWKPEAAVYIEKLTKAEQFCLDLGRTLIHSVSAPLLQPGMVVTIEPGIYFNDFLLKRFLQDPKQTKFINKDVLKRYIPVGGVRIEDDILITKKGYENLTTAAKGEEMLTIIRKAAKTASTQRL